MKSVFETYLDICNKNRPWTIEQEKAAIEKWYKTDKDKFVDEAFRHNLALVVKFAKKFPANAEDLIQVGSAALVKALRTYDPEKGKISSWVSNPILWKMRNFHATLSDELKAKARAGRGDFTVTSLDVNLNSEEGESEATLASLITEDKIAPDCKVGKSLVLGGGGSIYDNDLPDLMAELKKKLKKILRNANEEKVILGLMKGKTLMEMSVTMNLSRMRLTQISKSAYSKIRRSEIGNRMREFLTTLGMK